MSEQDRRTDAQDNSSASDSQRPESVPVGGNLVLGAIVFTLAGMVLLALVLPVLQSGKPATRSEQVETERRMAEIEQAEREFAASLQENTSTGSDHDAPPSHAGND